MSQAHDYTPALLDALETLKKRELANKEPFKARAYQTVIQQLRQRQDRQEPVHTMTDLADVKGMGTKIREKVQEILETGQLRAAEAAKERYDLKAHEELQSVYGIGPAKATELIRQGIHSVAELRRRAEKDKALLNDKQRIGLAYYEDLLQRIPREEMVEHEALLLRHAPVPAELVGSYRRGAASSGDVDVLLRVPRGQTAKEIEAAFYGYVQQLVDSGYVQEILALGAHKCMAIARLPGAATSRRVDLLVTPDEEYACALLYFTGSDRFNVAFRQHALQRGYTLNEHRLQALPQASPQALSPPYMEKEQDLFDFLGLEYVPPQERVDASSLRIKRPRIRRPVKA
jgi:DNA polymerase/3'-5' exonuclease PolX